MKTEMVAMQGLEREFCVAVQEGIAGFARAGQLLIEMQKKDPEVRQRLVEKYGLQHSLLTTLERIGRGELQPQLVWGSAKLRRLSPGEQKRAIGGPVDALVLTEKGHDLLKVDLLKAPKEMQEQLVNGDHIRTIDEQRAYLAAKANSRTANCKAEATSKMPWKVVGKTIRVLTAPGDYTRGDLLNMLKALEA